MMAASVLALPSGQWQPACWLTHFNYDGSQRAGLPEGLHRRASAAVPTQRTAVASRCSSWPPTRPATMPHLPLHVHLAGAATLAPADPLPPRFAELRPAEWPWSARLLTRSLRGVDGNFLQVQYILHGSCLAARSRLQSVETYANSLGNCCGLSA